MWGRRFCIFAKSLVTLYGKMASSLKSSAKSSRPLEEVFAALDLRLELGELSGAGQVYNLRTRIFWTDEEVRHYDFRFLVASEAGMELSSDCDLSDCLRCEDKPELLPTCDFGGLDVAYVQPLNSPGATIVDKGQLWIHRCKNFTCQRLYLSFLLDMSTLDDSLRAFRRRYQTPNVIIFQMPRQADFQMGTVYEYHRINVDRQCTF